MKEILKALVQQAFQSQNERIEALQKEVQELREKNNAQEGTIKNLEELNNLFDKAITELKDYMRNYVVKDDETNLMEEYKFGEQDRKQSR